MAIVLGSADFYACQAQGKKDMESPFGVLEFLHWNHPWGGCKYPDRRSVEKTVALMKEAGVAIVRTDFLWEDIEPEQGKFDFAKYDMIVDVLEGAGIDILGILNYGSSWASCGGEWNMPAQDDADFVNYAAETIRRYKGKIKYWEVWNEPDSAVYWKAQDGLKSYCALLKKVYLVAKKANPECKILNGGLANGPAGVNRLYDHGAKDYFDILNIHYFQNPAYPGAAKGAAAYSRLAHKIMARNGDAGKKIWITEVGCPGVPAGTITANWWLGKNPDLKQQARWVKDVFTILLQDKNVEKIFWAFFRDCQGHWGTGVDYFGIVDWDFSRKPAFTAYKNCVQQWKKERSR